MAVAVRDPNLDRLRLYALKKRRAQQQEPPADVLAWAQRYRRIDGQPFSLARFEPLRAIYQDTHPHVCIIKPAQRGVSEFAINYTTFALDRGAAIWTNGEKDGLNVGYIFPTREALGDFSKERITGLVQESPHLAQLFSGDDDFNAITFKQVGRSYLYLRGGWSESSLLSFAADLLVLDEFDRMDPKTVALAQRRMNASIVRRELDISTPTIPGQGIHAQYLRSDRHVYEQRHACGEWVSFDFFRDVRVDGQPHTEWRQWSAERIGVADVALACPVCQESLSTAERCAPGRWRAEAPEITGLRGYWVPWWPFPVCDLARLAITAISQDPSQIEELYRSDLGLPYEVGGSRITREQLAALSHELPNGLLPDLSWHSTTMGVDVGTRFHYRVSSTGSDGHRYVRAMGSVTSWDELDTLMGQYNVRLCVIDAFPEQHAARAFVDRHDGRAVTATYPTANALKGVMFAPDAVKAVADGRVQINRTMAMDAVYAAVATARDRWPAAIHNDPEVIEHMTAPVRVETQDAHGQPRADWVHTRPDHMFHSSVYDSVARALLPSTISAGGFAMAAARDSRVRGR
ncbi:MAG: terminase gpA endonuclease subunit [Chloroflexota bacterium]